MTPATRHTKEARRSGPEAERSEDPSTWTRLLARIACPSCASNLQRHRAMCGALNRSAQRTPVDGHLTCVCCSYPRSRSVLGDLQTVHMGWWASSPRPLANGELRHLGALSISRQQYGCRCCIACWHLGGGAVCAGGTSCSLAFVVCDL